MNILKRILSLAVVTVFTVSLSVSAQDRMIPNSEIPAEIQVYINTHFPELTVIKAEIDRDARKKEYEITLSDRTELDFSSQYKIKKIDGKGALPESVIPAEILEYVKTNYPDNVITDWEISRRRQEVELDNGLDLEFTLNGKFVRIDY